jgi:hypothetical protein
VTTWAVRKSQLRMALTPRDIQWLRRDPLRADQRISPVADLGHRMRAERKMLSWFLIVLAMLVAIPLLLGAAGFLVPRQHQTTRNIELRQSPEAVWSAVSDFAAGPTWRKDLHRVERGEDRNGHPVWIEVSRSGRLPLEVVESIPPARLMTRIADQNLPFGGTWTWEITATEKGCTVRITEDGEIHNPIFRFLARFVFGYHSTIETYLRSLGRKFNEAVQPT